MVLPTDQSMKVKEGKKKDKFLDLAGELKFIEHESDGDNWCTWSGPKRIRKRTV